MKAFFRNLKIKYKIRLFSIGMAFVLTAVMLWFSGMVVTHSVLKRTKDVTRDNMERIAVYLQKLDNSFSARFRHLENSISMRQLIRSARGEAEGSWSVDALLRDIRNAPYISEIEIFTMDGEYLAGTGGDERKQTINSRVVERLRQSGPDENLWYDEGYSNTINTEELSIYRVLRQEEQEIGIARIRMSTASLADVYNYVGFNIASAIYMHSGRGNLLLPKDSDPEIAELGRYSFRLFREEQVLETDSPDRAYRLQGMLLPKFDIYLMSAISYKTLSEDARLVQVLLSVLGGVFIVIELLVSEAMARSISGPIVHLSGQMRKVSGGDLSLRLNNPGLDEIGTLSRNFDSMLDKLVALMDEIENVQKRKRELELILLQTQITPHFLYNSLEGLSALAQLENAPRLYEMSRALGGFYRGVLSDGRSVVRLSEELQMIRNYLEVQSMRYRDVFSYEIVVPGELMDIGIVKLTIQPLVENAIYHGVRNVHRHGLINISGRAEGDTAVITIRDNGKGMPPQDRFAAGKGRKGDLILHRKGFGMQNADQRIKLYFGREYGLEADSVPDVGTRIDIRLPLRPYEENENDFGFNRG